MRRLKHITLIFFTVFLWTCSQPPNPSNKTNPSPKIGLRQTVFISDLHMGLGQTINNERWHPTEDFRWYEEFDRFLLKIDAIGQGDTDLVILGDLFELWQTDVDDCNYDKISPDFGCTEDEALNRLKHVLSQHTPELNSLGRFADSGNNRVYIIPGNHDAALLFSKVADVTLSAIPARKGRVHINKSGSWLSADGLLYGEHGHQIPGDINWLNNWPTPFLKDHQTKKIYIQRSLGERIVQKYYNRIERKYPIIDNIAEEWMGYRLGIKSEGLKGTFQETLSALKVFLFQISWRQASHGLGDEWSQGDWDIDHVRKIEGNRFIFESFSEDDPLRMIIKEAYERNSLRLSIDDLTDDEIRTLCDYRQLQCLIKDEEGKKRTIAPCVSKNAGLGDDTDEEGLGALSISLFRSRDRTFRNYLNAVRENLNESNPNLPFFKVYVYGHTHRAESGFYPFPDDASWCPIVVNCGAWQRRIGVEDLKKIQDTRNYTDREVLRKLQPEDLTEPYTYITVPKYQNESDLKVILKYWRIKSPNNNQKSNE